MALRRALPVIQYIKPAMEFQFVKPCAAPPTVPEAVSEKQYFEQLLHISHTFQRKCSKVSATPSGCGSGWCGCPKKFDRSATFGSSVLASRLFVRLQKFKKLEGSCFLCLTRLLERDTIALSSLRLQVVVEGAFWGYHDEGATCTDITKLGGSYT